MKKKRKIINIYEVKVLLLTCGESFQLSPNKSGDCKEESFDWMTDEKPIFRKIYRPLPLHFPITFSRVNRAKNLNGICISIKTSPNKRKQRGWQLFYVLWHYFSEVPIKCLLIQFCFAYTNSWDMIHSFLQSFHYS